MSDLYISFTQAAELCKVDPSTIGRWMKEENERGEKVRVVGSGRKSNMKKVALRQFINYLLRRKLIPFLEEDGEISSSI